MTIDMDYDFEKLYDFMLATDFYNKLEIKSETRTVFTWRLNPVLGYFITVDLFNTNGGIWMGDMYIIRGEHIKIKIPYDKFQEKRTKFYERMKFVMEYGATPEKYDVTMKHVLKILEKSDVQTKNEES